MYTFDFIVIGGGMMGAPCARHLAEGGHSVALVAAPEPLDYRDHPGPFGSHYDAARITRRVAHDPDWALASQRSIARYREIEGRSGQDIFAEVGAVMAGPPDGPLAGFTAGLRTVAQGLDGVEMMDADAVANVTGLRLPLGSVASIERDRAGWMAPRAMVRAQMALGRDAGVTVFPKAAAARVGRVVTLADGTEISGGHVVVATGPHAAADGLLDAWPAMKVWGRTIALARLSEDEAMRLRDMPSVIWVPEGWEYDLYALPPVRYPDGHMYLKIGGEVASPRIEQPADMAAWFAGGGDRDVGASLMAELRKVVPDLDLEAEVVAPCAVVWTETDYPYIAPAGDGVTVLCGGNGAAAKCGDELGRLGALVATGEGLAGQGYRQDFRAVWA